MRLWFAGSNISIPAWISSAGIWLLHGVFYFFNLDDMEKLQFSTLPGLSKL
jgi:hypothetical protein